MPDWKLSQKVGKRRATIYGYFPRPPSPKAHLLERGVWFLLKYYPPIRDLQIFVHDIKWCQAPDTQKKSTAWCLCKQLIHIPYRQKPDHLLFLLGHEWGHARGYDNEMDCHLLGDIMWPVVLYLTDHPALDDPSKVRSLVQTAVDVGEVPYNEHSTHATPNMLQKLMDELTGGPQ